MTYINQSFRTPSVAAVKNTISCQAAIQAKQKYRIDDFLFYTNSTRYLFSKLESLIDLSEKGENYEETD